MSDGRAAASSPSTSGLASCSGAQNRNSVRPARSDWNAAARVPAAVPASRRTASSSRSRSASTWSRCRAISGETTRVGPSSSRAGTW
nr:hypothetical protein [Nonomuraea terrae]